MPSPAIEINDHGLIKRLGAFNSKAGDVFLDGVKATLNILHENVPAYAPKLPGQKYVRTENLGRSFGSGFGGGKQGSPDIFTAKKMGQGYEGRFGSRLGYAEEVVGEGKQDDMFFGRWWTDKTIVDKSISKITALWNAIANKLAAFLDGKGK